MECTTRAGDGLDLCQVFGVFADYEGHPFDTMEAVYSGFVRVLRYLYHLFHQALNGGLSYKYLLYTHLSYAKENSVYKYDGDRVYHMSMIGEKVKVTATMDPELTDWIDKKIKSRKFASRSHALEVAVSELMNAEKTSAKSHHEDPCKASMAA